MIPIENLPAVNASLNATSGVLLAAGFLAVRRGRIGLHRALMIAAFVASTAFLACYLVYHYHTGSKPFAGPAWSRPIYYTILLTHVVPAAALLPLVLITLRRALQLRFDDHRRLARWTWPIWMYVSVTGVVVYWMLYHLFPGS